MLKMKGTLAVPGEHTKGEETYIKTADALKEATLRYPILPLTYGHINHYPPTPQEQIGTVSQKWCDKEQKVIGEFWLHEEKIPEVLRKRIDNGEKISISADYEADIDENKNQTGISYTHVAVLDGEAPVCPLEKCGIFERMPFSETQEITPVEKQPEKEPEVAPEEVQVEPEPVPEAPKPEEPAEQKPEDTSEPVVQEEEVRLEPEVIIPASAPVQQKLFAVVDGNYVFVPEIFRQKEKK